MKTALRFIIAFLIGGLIGFAIVCLILSLITTMSFTEFIEKALHLNLYEIIVVPLASLALAVVAGMLHIILHEAGHLVGGLATGYKFVSFRILSFTLLRDADSGKICCKRFDIAGTGGQCLLAPPELPIEKIPVFWYNLSGVFVNLILSAVGVVWLLAILDDHSPLQAVFAVFIVIVGLFLSILNGIPMRVSGIPNDALNYLLVRRKSIDRKAMMTQLRVNAALQRGLSPTELPQEWFTNPSVDYTDTHQCLLEMMRISLHICRFQYDEAYRDFATLSLHRDKMKGMIQMELDCEMAFLALVVGDSDRVESLLSDKLMKYVDTSARVMTSKSRLLFAIALLRDNDRNKASEILDKMLQNRRRYLLKGEADSDIAICKDLLTNHAPIQQ